ncbi:MAG: precorrin-8X methylmutase [Oscillospiraceae bacterium]|nr:precorrin-8X methylmutase [Oscillospiraceae bacterium]
MREFEKLCKLILIMKFLCDKLAAYFHGFCPALVIGVPVGFVSMMRIKELIMNSGAPYILSKVRKGGSNVAEAICNALMYMIAGR